MRKIAKVQTVESFWCRLGGYELVWWHIGLWVNDPKNDLLSSQGIYLGMSVYGLNAHFCAVV